MYEDDSPSGHDARQRQCDEQPIGTKLVGNRVARSFCHHFGIIALLMPGAALLAFVLLFAAYMLIDGVLAIIAGVRTAQRHDRWGWLILEGILDFVAGGIAVVWPVITIVAFVFLMGAWAIVTGVLLFGASFRLNIPHGRWLMALAGAVSVIWGILL